MKPPKKKYPRLRLLIFMLVISSVVWTFNVMVVQAVTITSGSMEPTLHGGGRLSDDRVLVNKLAYKLGDPARWEVIIFNRDDSPIPFIKRLVGLPGETVEISRGDIFINQKRLAKPENIQQTLWLPISKPGLPLEPAGWERYGINVRFGKNPGEAHLTSVSLDDSAALRYVGPLGTGADRWVDLESGFDLSQADPGARIFGILGPYRFVIGVGNKGGAQLFSGSEEPVVSKPDAGLVAGQPVRIVFSRLDGWVRLTVEGTPVFAYEEPASKYAGMEGESRAPQLGVMGGKATLSQISLNRDVYYTRPGGANYGTVESYTIPPGHYFFLGDNSSDSRDSRFWGPVPRKDLIGRGVFVLNRFKSL